MKKNRGTITFFMSIVYLTLITFAVGIVEGYRVKYLYAKQEEIGRLAIQNLKAEYMADIFDEYGLLFLDEKLANTKYTLDKTYETGFKDEPEITYFQDFLYSKDPNEQYHFPFFKADPFAYQRNKKSMDYQTLVDAKQEAILFARDKIPFSIAGDWLEKIQVWRKGLKAEEWIKKKERLMKDLHDNDRKRLKLYLYLDGVTVDEKKHGASLGGEQARVNFFNINQATAEEKITFLRQQQDLPDNVREEMVGRQFLMTDIYLEMIDLFEAEIEIIEEEAADDDAEDEAGGQQNSGNSAFPGYGGLDEADDIINAEEEEKEKRWGEATKEILRKLDEVRDNYNRAIDTVTDVLEIHKKSNKQIKKFLEDLELADIGSSVKDGMRKELETILGQFDEANGNSRVGNLKYIKEAMTERKDKLLEVRSSLNTDITSGESLLKRYQNALNAGKEYDTEKNEDFIERMTKKIESLNTETIRFHFPLSYQGYKVADEEWNQEALEKRQEQAETAGREMGENLPDIFEKVLNQNRLPSKVLSAPSSKDFDGQIPAITGSMLDQVIRSMQSMADSVVVNEYYFMVFSHFVLAEEDEMAISGYLKSDHARQGELEYLLFGKEERTNRALMVAALFAVRILFNVVALISDPVKMGLVSSWATTIAGWWSFGAGTAILSAIIVGLWSALETGVDIFMLFRGSRVSLIKTPNTWYTSLQGALSGFAMEAVEAAADAATSVLEKGVEHYQDTINHKFADLSTDLKTEINSRVAERADELRMQINAVDTQIKQVIGQAVSNIEAGKEQVMAVAIKKLTDLGLSREQATAIMTNALAGIETKKQELIQENYTARVEAIEEAVNQAQQKIHEAGHELQQKGEKAIKDKLYEIGDEINKMGKEAIKQKKELIKKKINDKFAKKAQTNADGNAKKDIREYIGFNYVDYLRLFLLLGFVDENTQWLRAMDLVQQNQQQQTPDFYILDCERKFEIVSTANYKPGFLPFGREGLFGQWADGKYQVSVTTEGGY